MRKGDIYSISNNKSRQEWIERLGLSTKTVRLKQRNMIDWTEDLPAPDVLHSALHSASFEDRSGVVHHYYCLSLDG